MAPGRLLWLLVPLLGLCELGAHFWTSTRAPDIAQWQAARAPLAALRKHGELVVVAPAWADPMARRAFGDALMPLRNEARPDESAYPRAIEVSILGSHAPVLAGWRSVAEQSAGRFRFRVLENPAPAKVLYDFVDHVDPGSMSAAAGLQSSPCAWSDHASVATGGLFGPATFPRRRFQCPAGPATFVGVTVIDDQDYRPRRCIWGAPPLSGPLVIHYPDVPIGTTIHGYAGDSWFLFRDGLGAPVGMQVSIGGDVVGSVVHEDRDGWKGFQIPTGKHAGRREDVEFTIQGVEAGQRHFCFYADSR